MAVVQTRCYVDTGPIVERVYAKYAGVGWIGKNTCIINQKQGSWLFLGVILTSLELAPDLPAPDRCGTCTRCIEACPTDALVAPYLLDSNLCISYLTIEKRGAIPENMREGVGRQVFGCDICQDVCPWNVRFSQDLREPAFRHRKVLDGDAREVATRILAMDDEAFRREFKGSAMKRAKRRGLARNAATVLGNVGTRADVDVLVHALEDPEPLVAEHATWALEQIAIHTLDR
jgi:epoxyqueuosine reductase